MVQIIIILNIGIQSIEDCSKIKIITIIDIQNSIMGVYLSEPVTMKSISEGTHPHNKAISYVSGQMQGTQSCHRLGWRKNMEDAVIHELNIGDGVSLFAVFDGHGGPEVSRFVANIFVQTLKETEQYKQAKYSLALDRTFQKVDQIIDSEEGNVKLKQIRKELGGLGDSVKVCNGTGCTANVVLITKQKYYIANSGDSRSALCRNGNLVVFSEDHKPQSKIESDRIIKAGGSIVMGRVNGGLNLTRALGDFDYKRNANLSYAQQMITCKPDIKQIEVDPENDQFIAIGCDGIWQKFVDNTQGFLSILRSQYKINKEPKKIMEDILQMLLAKDTRAGIGCDNMSAIFIKLKDIK